MFSFLKNHPFAVEAFFERSVVLTFSAPKEQLQHLIPECLALETFNNSLAFIAVAMVQTKKLRPKGFPKIFGNDFFLIGYRVFVRYSTISGKRLRGLYILKSETNKKKMEFFGNLFTHYNYTTVDINQSIYDKTINIRSEHSRFEVIIEIDTEEISLPKNSPFNNWQEARKFAGPLPFTFTYTSKTKNVLIVEGVRQNWHPDPVRIISYEIPFLHSLGIKGVQLANAFVIENVPYYWRKGKTEKWNA